MSIRLWSIFGLVSLFAAGLGYKTVCCRNSSNFNIILIWFAKRHSLNGVKQLSPKRAYFGDSEDSLLNQGSCLAPALAVTKFTSTRYKILVTLLRFLSPTQMFNKPSSFIQINLRQGDQKIGGKLPFFKVAKNSCEAKNMPNVCIKAQYNNKLHKNPKILHRN